MTLTMARLKQTVLLLCAVCASVNLAATPAGAASFTATYRVVYDRTPTDGSTPDHQEYTLTLSRIGSEVLVECVGEPLPSNVMSFTTWHYYNDTWNMIYFGPTTPNLGAIPILVWNPDGTFRDVPPDPSAGYGKPSSGDPEVWYRKSNGIYYFEPVMDDPTHETPVENVLMAGLPPKDLFGASWIDDGKGHLSCRFSDGAMVGKYEPSFEGGGTIRIQEGVLMSAELSNPQDDIKITASQYQSVGAVSIPGSMVVTGNDTHAQRKATYTLVSSSAGATIPQPSPPLDRPIHDYRVNGQDLTWADYMIDAQLHPSPLRQVRYLWNGQIPSLSDLAAARNGYLAWARR
jgi:hypothetical protein